MLNEAISGAVQNEEARGPKQLTSARREATQIGRYYSLDLMCSMPKRIYKSQGDRFCMRHLSLWSDIAR